MKKKTVGLRIGISLFLCMLLVGCGPMEQVRNVAHTAAEKKDEDKKTEKASEAGISGEGEKAGNGESEAEGGPDSQVPVFGMEDIGDYDGFQYMQKEVLTAHIEEDKRNGRIRRKTVTLYIPYWDESWFVMNGELPGTAWASVFGVTFDFSINPYGIMEQEGASLEEMLQKHMDGIYYEDEGAVRREYGDLEIADIRASGENAVAATAKYCFYDDLEEKYHVCYRTSYLKELEPDMLALLDVTVDGQEATLETPELIEELEAFYEIDLGWDTEEMKERLDRYIEKSEAGFSSVIEFDFPEGWEIEFEDDEVVIYAPGGNSDGAGCGIAVGDLSSIALEEELPDGEDDEEYLKMIISEGLGEKADDVSIRSCGETCIGETMEAQLSVTDDNGTADFRLYLGRKGDRAYVIAAMQYQWLEMDTFGMDTFQLVEELLENGRLRE